MHETLDKFDGIDAPGMHPPPDAIGRASLFLDFDGTLAELAPTPDGVRVADALNENLTQLSARLSGRLAIVSGRSVEAISAFLAIDGLAIGGSHGLEMRWPDGRYSATEQVEGHAELIAELRAFAAGFDGMLVEEKPFGAALHYRGAPTHSDEAEEKVEAVAIAHGLSVQRGKMVFELRPTGQHKGDAIRAFMDGAPFSNGTPWFLGDDVTDEDGFEAVRTLGGIGVLVGPPRKTAARFRLPDVASVHEWLSNVTETAR